MKYWMTLCVILLAGCASNQLTEQQKTDAISSFITDQKLEDKKSITAFQLDGWTALTDQYLILRTSPFKPYLVKLTMRCSELGYSPTLAVYQRQSYSLSAGFDAVFAPGNQTFKCYINKIYPLTREQDKALRESLQAPEEKAAAKPDSGQGDTSTKDEGTSQK